MIRTAVRILALLGILALPAHAREDGGLVSFRVLHPDVAHELVAAAVQACRDRGYQVAAAVVDRFGVPQALLRDVLAGPHTPRTAVRKAWTAVSFRSDTTALAEATKAGAIDSGARFVPGALMLGGGVVIEVAGSIVGAVGVSGGPSGEEDEACARAGIEAVADRLPF